MRVALIQMNASGDRRSNLANAGRMVREAADRGARLVALPEFFGVYGPPDVMRQAREPLDGPTVSWARELAAELGIDLISGSFVERRPDGQGLYNTSVHVDPRGDLRAVYRKIHLFDATIPGAETRESALFDHGDQAVVTTAQDGTTVGLSVCYDIRFPELYRALAGHARILVKVAAFPESTTRDHWPTLLRARAIENQAFMLGCSQVGAHDWGRSSGGRSMICDPWGLVLAQANDTVGLVVADLDFDHQDWARQALPNLASRRPFAAPVD
ncbi:carbon-nitrogen hydrolase family protein [Streptomyces melanosporofaciens]|uniref:Predicted amidohydrolase n=1 Tax=Streptomyces melanosporofaciens TaxID=67327 RepID=A0A1H4KH97_STRMJ|nr:carbon-nitrogen hydrolase family protein [Streptomyces melanosporofaciens]SEB57495.1 Predicted amidohydrolase [Streptomyces melanosporofaciens]